MEQESASFPVVRSKNMLQNVHKQGPPKMSAHENGLIVTKKRRNRPKSDLTLYLKNPFEPKNRWKSQNSVKKADFSAKIARDNGRQDCVCTRVCLLLWSKGERERREGGEPSRVKTTSIDAAALRSVCVCERENVCVCLYRGVRERERVE